MMDNAYTREGPGLFIWDVCKDFTRLVPRLKRDDVNMDDIDTTQEDHIADEARYKLNTKRYSASASHPNT